MNKYGRPKNGKIIKCKTCNKEFYIQKHQFKKRKYCSNKCFPKKNLITAICVICGKEYKKYKSQINILCCSWDCALIKKSNSQKTGKYLLCKNCNKMCYVQKANIDKFLFCSRDCLREYKKKENKIKNRKICKLCGNEYYGHGKKFCSIKCLNVYRSQLCRKKMKYRNTKPELLFEKILKQNKIKHQKNYWVPWKHGWKKFYDFYIINKNTLVEIDGVYWHGKGKSYDDMNDTQKHSYNNDIIKNNLAKQKGYNLIRIWEDEFNNNKFKKIIGKLK